VVSVEEREKWIANFVMGMVIWNVQIVTDQVKMVRESVGPVMVKDKRNVEIVVVVEMMIVQTVEERVKLTVIPVMVMERLIVQIVELFQILQYKI
jgi:hypothetical protein